MASASPRLLRGKLLQVQEGKQGQRERFRKLAERGFVERADLADQPLAVEQPDLRKIGDRIAI